MVQEEVGLGGHMDDICWDGVIGLESMGLQRLAASSDGYIKKNTCLEVKIDMNNVLC
jgi:hypothetical protein